MVETRFQDLSPEDRHSVLRVAQERSDHRSFLREKDIWTVSTLLVLFDASFRQDLVLKGGTSLSKAWRTIRRFSEDVDITYGNQSLAPDLVVGTGEEALPPARSPEKRWTRAIRTCLAEWVWKQACPVVEEGLSDAGLAARYRAETERLHVAYEPVFEARGFVAPEVIVEFGARSTGEPHADRSVVCDAAETLPDLAFPEAHPIVVSAERTFWKKVTAIHVFCRQARRRGERLSRHWHDLMCPGEEGIAAQALDNQALGLSPAHHKAMFFDENELFNVEIERCTQIQARANETKT